MVNLKAGILLIVLSFFFSSFAGAQEAPVAEKALQPAPAPALELPGVPNSTPAPDPADMEPPITSPAAEPDPKFEETMAETDVLTGEQNAKKLADGPLAEAPTPAPSIKQGLFKTMVSLCLIIASIFGLAWLARRYGKKTPFFAGQHFGKVLGKIHLSPKASLHYVKTGDRVLLIGLTQESMTLLTEFNARTFEDLLEVQDAEEPQSPQKQGDFLAALRDGSAQLDEPQHAAAQDDELELLKGDIQRLQAYLKGNARDPQA